LKANWGAGDEDAMWSVDRRRGFSAFLLKAKADVLSPRRWS
jgi:hypothetical protein